MPDNIKAAVLVLAVVASASAWQFLRTVGGIQSLSSAITFTSPLPAADNDMDNDGLTNEEESYWNTDPQNPDTDSDGFKDGEEAASGHDPLIPGPDDKIITNNAPQNVTKKVATLVLAGLTEGSLKQTNDNRDAVIESLVDDIISQTQINAGGTETNKLNVVPDTAGAEATYAGQMRPFLNEIAEGNARGMFGMAQALDSYLNSRDPNDPNLASFFNGELSRIDQQIQRLQSMQVPKKWGSAHNQLLFLLKKSRTCYTLIREVPEDPVQALVAISDLSDVILGSLPDAIQEFKSLQP